MSGRQIGGVVCLLLAGLFVASAFLWKGDGGPPLNDPSMLGISYAIGRHLPGLLLLILGLWLLKTPIPKRPDKPGTPSVRRGR